MAFDSALSPFFFLNQLCNDVRLKIAFLAGWWHASFQHVLHSSSTTFSKEKTVTFTRAQPWTW